MNGPRVSVGAAAAVAVIISSALHADLIDPGPLAGGLHVNSIRMNTVALPLNSPPIEGFTPLVVFGLTDEKEQDELNFFATASSVLAGLPGSTTLPNGMPLHYGVALYDTGAQAHVFRDEDMAIFDLSSVGRVGVNVQELIGLAGSETAVISDPIGVYVAGFDAVTGTAPLTVNTAAMRGHYHVAVLSGAPGSPIPNLIGAPISHQYTTVIRNDMPQQLTVGNETFNSPLVQLLPRGGGGTPPTQYRARLNVVGVEGILAPLSPPAFLFGTDLFDFHNDPSASTFHGLYMMDVDVFEGSASQLDQPFLLDFGATVSAISIEVANDMGVDVFAPGFVPDFTVDVEGIGGTIPDVPGLILDTLNIDVTGGDLVYTDVPVLIVDLPDPRGGALPLPGIVGTNLFTDRNLVLNQEDDIFTLRISEVIPEPGTFVLLILSLTAMMSRRSQRARL